MTAAAHPSTYALDAGGPEVAAHLATCAACRERAEAARALDRRFADEVVPRTLGRVRSRLAEPPRRSWTSAFLVASGLAAAAALVLVVRPGPLTPTLSPPSGEREWVGIKGEAGPPFAVFVKRGADVWVLAPGQKLRAGDALRFVARVSRPRYLELRGRDAAGRERTLFPEGARAALVQPGEALPGGFVVDAAPGPEKLVALVSDHPFALGSAPEAGVEVVRIELPKEP